MGALTPVILGGLTTLIGNFFVNRQKQIAAEREFRATELAMANKVFDELSVSMATLAEASRDAMWALVLRPDRKKWRQEDHANWQAYNEALGPWNKSRARNRALTKKYFGEDTEQVLKEIQADLADLESKISATYFDRTDSDNYMTRKKDEKKAEKKSAYVKFRDTSDRLLDVDIVALTETMIDRIQKQEVGALHGTNF